MRTANAPQVLKVGRVCLRFDSRLDATPTPARAAQGSRIHITFLERLKTRKKTDCPPTVPFRHRSLTMLRPQRPRRNGTKKVFTDFIVGDVGDHSHDAEGDEKPEEQVTSDDESYTSEASRRQDEPKPDPQKMRRSRARATPVPSSTPSSPAAKPMRPLTAYHIFL